MRTFVLAGVLSGAVVVAPAIAAQAQESPARAPRFEVSVSFTTGWPQQDGAYTTDFVPSFQYTPHSGSAGQTLTVAAERAPGFAVGAAYFPHRRFGVQVFLNRFTSDLSGASGPYAVDVEYVANYPPDYVPTTSRYTRAHPWPNSAGSLTSLTISANLVARFGAGKVGAQVSGGPTIFRTSGSLRSLGYSVLWLGGHSTLNVAGYELEASIESASKLGLNAGGEVSVTLAPSIALLFDARYFWAPESNNEVRVARILDYEPAIDPESIAQIGQQMALQPIAIDPSFVRIAVGLKLLW